MCEPEGETKRHFQLLKTEQFTSIEKLRSGKPCSSPKDCILASDFQSLFYGSGRPSFTIQNDLAKNLGRNSNNQGNKSLILFLQNLQNYKSTVASNSSGSLPRRRIRPGSAIIHPGSSRGRPTSRIRHGSILRPHLYPKKYRFRFDGSVFDPKPPITSKCVGGLQGETSDTWMDYATLGDLLR